MPLQHVIPLLTYFVLMKTSSAIRSLPGMCLLLLLLFNFALCYIDSSCPDHVEFNLKAASFDKLAVVSLAATKWYIYLCIHMELFICLYVLLMYVHFLEIKYQSNQSIRQCVLIWRKETYTVHIIQFESMHNCLVFYLEHDDFVSRVID